MCMRNRNSVIYLFLTTCLITMNGASANEQAELQSWAVEFYAENTACTVAKIEALVRTDSRVSVELELEPATARALATGDALNRDNWMALHCPSPIHPAWKQNAPKFDVTIIASLDNLGQYELSCAQHHDTQAHVRQRKSEGVLARLKLLLNSHK